MQWGRKIKAPDWSLSAAALTGSAFACRRTLRHTSGTSQVCPVRVMEEPSRRPLITALCSSPGGGCVLTGRLLLRIALMRGEGRLLSFCRLLLAGFFFFFPLVFFNCTTRFCQSVGIAKKKKKSLEVFSAIVKQTLGFTHCRIFQILIDARSTQILNRLDQQEMCIYLSIVQFWFFHDK